jgi:hypothetical protein
MNERIVKLYEQAIVLEGNGDYFAGELDPAKFAELIVRECCQFENSYGGDAGLVARSFSDKIKKHFGIE